MVVLNNTGVTGLLNITTPDHRHVEVVNFELLASPLNMRQPVVQLIKAHPSRGGAAKLPVQRNFDGQRGYQHTQMPIGVLILLYTPLIFDSGIVRYQRLRIDRVARSQTGDRFR